MADAFLNLTEEQPLVNHIDGNKMNNDLSNLEVCNNSENVQHAYDNGFYDSRECHPIEVSGGDFLEPVQFKSIRQASNEIDINRKRLTGILNNEIPNNTQYNFKYL